MEAFKKQYESYRPLQEGWFRLVTILPGTGSDQICVHRQDVLLAYAPEYDALSYTWGTTMTGLQTIKCNRVDFLVTKNLFEGLQKFRDASEPHTIWIDAICINQQSGAECTQQLGIMVEIYSRAKQVSIWLGPHEDDPDLELMFQVADARTDYAIGMDQIISTSAKGETLQLFHPEKQFHQKIAAVRRRFKAEDQNSGAIAEPQDILGIPLSDDGPFSNVWPGTIPRASGDDYPGYEGSRLVVQLFPDFDPGHVDKVVNQEFSSFKDFMLEVTKPAELLLSDADKIRVLRGEHKLLSKPYWNRAWIVQEIIVSKNARVYCGSYNIAFDVLAHVYGKTSWPTYCIKSFTHQDMHFWDAESSVRTWKRLVAMDPTVPLPHETMNTVFDHLCVDYRSIPKRKLPRTTLAEMLLKYGSQQALDSRDRVFSLLNTLRAFSTEEEDTEWARSLVNYDISKRTLFIEVAKHILHAYRQRDAGAWLKLKHHIFDCHAYMSPEERDLPSWVPEWDMKRQSNGVGTGRNVAEIDTVIPFQARVEGETLFIQGHIVDYVSTEIEKLVRSQNGTDNMLQEVELYRRICDEGGGMQYAEDNPDEDAVFEAFWRTIIIDNVLGTKPPQDQSKDFGPADREAAAEWVAHCAWNYSLITDLWGPDRLFARKSLLPLALKSREVKPKTNGQERTATGYWLYWQMSQDTVGEDKEDPVTESEILAKRSVRDMMEMEKLGYQCTPNILEEPEWMAAAARSEYGDRNFFQTRKGFFGLGPDSLQVGDAIAVVGGFERPVCLRPRPGGHYVVVGTCWMYGLMYSDDSYYSKGWGAEDLYDIEIH